MPSVEVATARMPESGSPGHGHVVLVPGLGVLDYLRPTVEVLTTAGWQVTVLRPPGWPGHRAARPRGPALTMRGLGEAVARWLRASGNADVVLVGHSIGAQVAAHAAAVVPDLVSSLVLAGPTADPAYRSRSKLAGRMLLTARHEPRWLVASQARDWWRTGPSQLRHLIASSVDDALEATLLRCPGPHLVLLGERDHLCRPEWAATLPAARVVRLPGAHGAVATNPEDLAAVLAGAGGQRGSV